MLDSEEMEMTDMKTEKSLLDDMLSEENLSRAYQQVVRNKGAEGVDGMKYTELKDYLKEHGDEIKRTDPEPEVQAKPGAKGRNTKRKRWDKVSGDPDGGG